MRITPTPPEQDQRAKMDRLMLDLDRYRRREEQPWLTMFAVISMGIALAVSG